VACSSVSSPERLVAVEGETQVSWAEIVASVMFIVWPLLYRHQMRKIHDKMVARGADVERFDRRMDRPFFRVMLWVIPLLGVGVLIGGLTAS
jgi:hypothetical protein